MAYRHQLRDTIFSIATAACLLPGPLWAQAVQMGFFNVDSDDASRRPVARHVARYPEVALWGFTQVWDSRWESELVSGFAKARGVEAKSLLGTTGGTNRNLLVYDASLFSLVKSGELPNIEPRGSAAAPLFGQFRYKNGQELLVVVVQMDRASEANRKAASSALAKWAAGQSLPVVLAGSMNLGLDPAAAEVAGELSVLAPMTWVRLDPVMATACPPYDAIQDFVLVNEGAGRWVGRSWVLSPEPAYCPDSELTSSHRPVAVELRFPGPAPEPEPEPGPGVVSEPAAPESGPRPDQVMQKIEALEAEIRALKEQLQGQESTPDED